jgi:hypothetical protein
MGAVPESLRQIIEQQLHQVSPEDHGLLEVASLAGREFSATAVAPVVNQGTEDIEARLAVLAQRGQFVRSGGLNVAGFHKLRRDDQRVYEWAQATRTLGRVQESQYLEAQSTVLLGWALAVQGQSTEGITQIHQGLAAWQAIGTPHLRAWKSLSPWTSLSPGLRKFSA